jgi:hypothetical protein
MSRCATSHGFSFVYRRKSKLKAKLKKTVHHSLALSAPTTGAFNTGFHVGNLHRPTFACAWPGLPTSHHRLDMHCVPRLIWSVAELQH